jgi:hypothetical protein
LAVITCRGTGRQRGGKGLALAGIHFREHAPHHQPAAIQLHIEMTHAERASGRLAHQRKGLYNQFILQALAQQQCAQVIDRGI